MTPLPGSGLDRNKRWVLAFLVAVVTVILVGAALWLPIPDGSKTVLALDIPIEQMEQMNRKLTQAAPGDIVVLAWNDLGMHCYNRDFEYLAVLPPFNTLYAQVIRAGDPPTLVTSGITVTYHFPDNTFSVGKSNFWDYDQQLFGVDLAPNVGLAGKGLAGNMDLKDDHFVAEGIPLTEFRDSDYAANPDNTPAYPYQLATVEVWDSASGEKLTESTVVAPVSTEMHCDNCHYDGGVEDIATGSVELNILTLHDKENADEYPAGHRGNLVDRTPVLCAECHSSNALGAPGVGDLPSLSRAMHKQHSEGEVGIAPTTDGCYQCHPGPQTKCLRDTMSDQGMTCVDCHGSMRQVSQNPNPWFNEPRCDNSACHGGDYAQNQPLYRLSQDHGDIFCAGCHDSPHAIAPSTQPNDAIKFIELQGAPGPLSTCGVCHVTSPSGSGPHGLTAPTVSENWLYLPNLTRE